LRGREREKKESVRKHLRFVDERMTRVTISWCEGAPISVCTANADDVTPLAFERRPHVERIKLIFCPFYRRNKPTSCSDIYSKAKDDTVGGKQIDTWTERERYIIVD